MRGFIICLFINLFLCFSSKSQQVFTITPSDKPYIYNTRKKNINTFGPAEIKINENLFNNTSVKTVPCTFYYNSIGFFCQKELQIEKTMKFPLKFRLGSVTYTDQMEGKGRHLNNINNR